jgi:hypothetical protein
MTGSVYCAALKKRCRSRAFAFGWMSVMADYAALIRPRFQMKTIKNV